MLRVLSALLAFAVTVVSVQGDGLLIQPNDSIAICGDSITDQRIYSVFLEDYLLMCQPTPGQTVAQLGWGGEQAPSFLARLNSDLYPFRPNVVTTCYGMNDGHYQALTPVASETYRQAQTAIVEALKKHGVRVIVLGSTKCVDSDTFRHDPSQAETYNETLKYLAGLDRDIARQEGVIYAEVYEATSAAMEKSKAAYGPTYIFGGNDGVHPGPNGALVMVYAFLKALGCNGAIGTVTIDLASHRATGTPGQRVLSYDDGTVTLESSRYPFCFDGNPDVPDQHPASILKFVPFNEELNRYMLVVRGLTSESAQVTWGRESKIFTRAQLTSGINLAAEFLQNPFVVPFRTVSNNVYQEQNYQAGLVRVMLHNLATWKSLDPARAGTLDAIAQESVAQSRALSLAAAASVVPVRHSIKVTPSP